MELGQTKDLSEPFIARRGLIHKAAAKDIERIMSRFKMVSLSVSSAPVQTTGYSFWKKTAEPDVVNLLDDDSLNPDDVMNCPLCREEFKKFSKKRKEKCLICSRIVCNTCHANSLPVKGAADGFERDVKMCNTCYTTITKEHKRLQLKQFFASSAKSSFTTFYEEVFFLVSVIQRDLPKLRNILDYPLTATTLKKAKELDQSLGKNMQDFEREIKNLEHFQVNTKKQQQVRDAVKMGFITSLSGTGPEYKLLHKQLEVAATQPLAPDEPTTSSLRPAAHHSRSHSATYTTNTPSATPAPTMTPVLTSNKDKRRTLLGNKLSSFTSLFSGDASKATTQINSEEGPYISGINPVLSPMSGGIRITILGDRFHSKCGVLIGNEECTIIERQPGTLVVLSPSQTSPAPQDVCVYNPSGDKFVMEQMLFYADDQMFVQETPTVPEDKIYNPAADSASTSQYTKPTEHNHNSQNYNNNPNNYININNNHNQNNNHNNQNNSNYNSNYNNNHNNYNNHNNQNTMSSSYTNSNSSVLGTSATSGRTFGPPLSSSASANSLNTYKQDSSSSSAKNFHQKTPPKNVDYEIGNLQEGEISMVIIKPLISPLQGTRVTMELSRALPPSASIKIGGKTIQAHPSDENPREISFISPPLSAGPKSVEIVLPNGKSVLMENILQYDNFSPQIDNYASVTHKATPPPSGRVWGKRA